MLKSISVGQSYQVFSVLQAIFTRFQNEPIQFQVSYPISKNRIAFSNEVEIFNAERQKMIDLYAERDENGKIVMLSPIEVKIKADLKMECDVAFTKFMNKMIEINVLPIFVKDVMEDKNAKFTLAELTVLDFMLVDEEVKADEKQEK